MNRIKLLRQQLGIKQSDLAKAVNVSQAALSGYETGKFQADIQTYNEIADYFGVTLDYLLCRTDENKKPASETGDGCVDVNSALSQELVTQLMQLSPEEQRRASDFVQGLLAARADEASPRE